MKALLDQLMSLSTKNEVVEFKEANLKGKPKA